MKDPEISKSRLRDSLAPEARKRLAVQLFRNTVDVLIKSVQMSGEKFDIAVITNSTRIKKIAEENLHSDYVNINEHKIFLDSSDSLRLSINGSSLSFQAAENDLNCPHLLSDANLEEPSALKDAVNK